MIERHTQDTAPEWVREYKERLDKDGALGIADCISMAMLLEKLCVIPIVLNGTTEVNALAAISDDGFHVVAVLLDKRALGSGVTAEPKAIDDDDKRVPAIQTEPPTPNFLVHALGIAGDRAKQAAKRERMRQEKLAQDAEPNDGPVTKAASDEALAAIAKAKGLH